MTNSFRPLTVFYDRNPQDGMRHDVKVYALGFRRGPIFEINERFRFFASLTANLIGARMMRFQEEEGKSVFQPLAANPESGFIWNPNEKTTLTFSAFGVQGHWGIGTSDLMYYTKARLDVGDKLTLAAKYDWYRFNGNGLSNFNTFIVGAKIFTTNWFRRRDQVQVLGMSFPWPLVALLAFSLSPARASVTDYVSNPPLQGEEHRAALFNLKGCLAGANLSRA